MKEGKIAYYFNKAKDNLTVYEKDTKKIYKFKYIFLIVCFYIFTFQYAFQDKIAILHYFDEFYAMLFFPLVVIKLLKTYKKKEKIKIAKEDKIILICSIAIIGIGLIGNIIYKYQEMFVVPQEILLVFKFLLSFYTTKILFEDLDVYGNEKIANHTKLITIFLFVLVILDYIFDFFPHQIRYGLKTEQLFFGHQTGLAAVMVVNLALLLFTSNSKHKNLYIFLNLLIIFSTLRAKALAIVGAFIVLYYWLIVKKRDIGIKLIIVIIVASMLIASQQISVYFMNEKETPRSALLTKSFMIANDHFPVGSGFGTFGTHLSGEVYSKVYEKYNIDKIYGLTRDNTSFISDSFWPAIIAEFGYFGLILYCIILIMIYKKIHRKYNENRLAYITALIPILYLLICSTAESAFLHTMSVPMFIIISLAVNSKIKDLKQEGNQKMKNYVLFDTSQGTQNLGDFIIMEAITKQMNFLLEGNFVTHFSTHTPIARWYQNFKENMTSKACDKADKKFICGTNIFKNSLIRITPDWNINAFNIKYYKDSIAIGCGMDTNAKKMDFYTKWIYKNILSKEYVHSVRDERTKKMLEGLGFKAINTGCPTLWNFTEEFCAQIPTKKSKDVIFTLTFYNKNLEVDQFLIDTLIKNYEKIYFWVQGSEDYEYLKSLKNTENVIIINPTLESYREILQKGNIDYVGTRLHAGIYAMANKVRSIIISIDNRAQDMAETYNINTINKDEIASLDSKINSEFKTNINIDQEKINEWKSQFKK